jgi:hypothetical protein
MQIACDFAGRRNARDAELWRDDCGAMFRAKMLTCSVGLLDRLGLGEEARDEQLLEGLAKPVLHPSGRLLGRRGQSISVLSATCRPCCVRPLSILPEGR